MNINPAIEQIAAQNQLGVPLKLYNQDRARAGCGWLMCGMGLLFLYAIALFLLDGGQTIWTKLLLAPISILLVILLIYTGIACERSSIQINALLRENTDESRNSYNTIVLYERGLISNKWMKYNGTWENQFVVIPWYNISHLQLSQIPQQGGSTNTFAIKTRNGQTIDISLGGQELFSAIEQRMNTSTASTS